MCMEQQVRRMIVLPTNNLISNLVNVLNQLVSASQMLLPYVAAIFIISALFLYMYSDKFADQAKTKLFKVFISIGGIAGVTSIVTWIQQTARF